jgi:hypothetical protein
MLRYWYAETPLVIVWGVLVLLALPFLPLVTLAAAVVLALAVLAGLAWVLVVVPYELGRAVVRHWHSRDMRLSTVSPVDGEAPTHIVARA